MRYEPKPIDTSGVDLPPALLELTEKLAEHIHDVWAELRFSQGWTYGPRRDDASKEHPCLVPYAQLSDDEKKYDRETALGSLKAIIALGYRVQKGPGRMKTA